MAKIPQHYVPGYLSRKSKQKARRELLRSRRAYKKNKYHTRAKIPGFKSKKTKWTQRVKKIYGIRDETITMGKLAKATKCSKYTLKKIVKKGQGAYYSSGSRPNQTPHSWGYARLYSAVTGGPASRVDRHILEKGCKKTSKALKLAKKAKRPTKRKKISLRGGGGKTGKNVFANIRVVSGGAPMKETIVEIVKSPNSKKKYMAIVKNKKTKKTRRIHFGASDYEQYKDRTKLHHYTHKNHGSRKRMRNYFKRHSGIPFKNKAIAHEKRKSNYYYNAKILSHMYLW